MEPKHAIVAAVAVCAVLPLGISMVRMINENDNKPKHRISHPSYGYWMEDKDHNFTPTGRTT